MWSMVRKLIPVGVREHTRPFRQYLRDDYPIKVEFYDGTFRTAPRNIDRLLKHSRRCPSKEREYSTIYCAYKGGDMIDIGAFHGLHSVLLAPKAKRGDVFVSFEPDSRAYPELLRNLSICAKLFPSLKFCVFPLVVGNGQPVFISYHQGKDGHPSYLSVGENGNCDEVGHSIDNLVNLMKLHPLFIKVDVEGAEYEVLEGMGETLAVSHPQIMLELHPEWLPPGRSVSLIEKLLKSYGCFCEEIDRVHQIWRKSESLGAK